MKKLIIAAFALAAFAIAPKANAQDPMVVFFYCSISFPLFPPQVKRGLLMQKIQWWVVQPCTQQKTLLKML